MRLLRMLVPMALCLPLGHVAAQGAPGGSAAAYPVKPVKLIMPFPAGGPTDIVGRLLGQRLTEAWGQQVVIDNRPGGGGIIGGQLAAKSAPDGYTLFLGGITTLVLSTYTHKNRPYDSQRDFVPVTLATMQPLMLQTHPTLPVKTVKDYLALARARPGQINYGTSGPGGSGHLAGELLRQMTGIDIVHVPYRGAPPAINDLIAGQVQSMFSSPLAVVSHIRSGKIRALAITGAQRSAAVPDVPTFAEAGLPGYDASTWNGIMVPTGTPRAIIERLNSEAVKILRAPSTQERLSVDGSVAVGSTPEEYAAFIAAEHAKWSKVVRSANIRIE
jgi:tripartite-type tricarboxylate transporter receptor subunit TctC